MKKEYWFILIAYIVMQLSGAIGVPLLMFIGSLLGKSHHEVAELSVSLWIVISFSLTFIISLILLRKEWTNPIRSESALSPRESMYWAVGGIFLAFFAQIAAANIEYWLGIEMGSENTEQIVSLIKTAPIVILVTSIIGPILEEIVFRKILFGALYTRMNFFLAGLISSLIFALAHGEPEHVILYSAMGFTFAFLYVKTKRILVPIFAHVSMNTIVVIMQLNPDWIQKLQQL
ncbi:CPBP family intramembrane glutamic endopeptidase [Niallia endozanthoxylica]|uniref:CPBP family intramembrane metalloprotease n=1 Tax=Niallia endozanthoxylica TaxID=2036016 RepID=A0A5J5H7V5_9BACI|nr:type II CAAX endopeptidase family protein [Niallia endozanthoxylica]KAA9016038.1 CPBP family intramembrane metalloprotease [Niallia endozanthoxylica]